MDVRVDYTRNIVDSEVFETLLELASECEIENRILEMCKGYKLNFTEKRSVLHVALR